MLALHASLNAVLGADTQLQTLAPGGCWPGSAPEGTAGPVVVWSIVSTDDSYTQGDNGGGRIYEDIILSVKGIAEAESPRVTGLIAERLDALLTDQDSALTTDDLTVHECRRIARVEFPELTKGGTRYWHGGGRWHLMVSTPS